MAMNYDGRDREVTFEIVEEIGIISSSSTGWTKELNVVAWNGGQGKYDIREWAPQHDRMSRGITLNEQEMRMILDLLKRRNRFVPRGTTVAKGYGDEPIGGTSSGTDDHAASGAESGTPGAAGVPEPSDDEAWDAAGGIASDPAGQDAEPEDGLPAEASSF